MANQLNCLRCGTGMQFIRREKFQLGQTGWMLGDLPNLFAGAMEIEIYVCPKCGKLEFFQPGRRGKDRLRLSPARCAGRSAAQKVSPLWGGARL